MIESLKYRINRILFKKRIGSFRKSHCQIYWLISTPYFGNVGDHTIELAQQELLKSCELWERTFEIDSNEFRLYRNIIDKTIKDNDIILIDGGGNFGDVWPETIDRINNVISSYLNNRILIFPESWFYSDSVQGREKLNETVNAFSHNPNVILYARDSWSYSQMKKSLPNTVVKLAYDMVFYKTVNDTITHREIKTVGVCVREDKEAQNTKIAEQVIESLETYGYKNRIIHNDCYKHIQRDQREQYFCSIYNAYKNCQLVITDRFHGLVFSIISGTPCIIIDNLTGKVLNFYKDISDTISGVCVVNNDRFEIKNIEEFISNMKMIVKPSFKQKLEIYKQTICDDLKGWREI